MLILFYFRACEFRHLVPVSNFSHLLNGMGQPKIYIGLPFCNYEVHCSVSKPFCFNFYDLGDKVIPPKKFCMECCAFWSSTVVKLPVMATKSTFVWYQFASTVVVSS